MTFPINKSIAPQVVAIIMLVWALMPFNPYGYYVLLRFIIMGICLYLAAQAHQAKKIGWVWALGICAILYNPFFSAHLGRGVWVVVNVATIVMMAWTIDSLKASKDY